LEDTQMAICPIRVRRRGPLPTRTNAFSLIELLVVIGIIAVISAILFPVFAQARAKARQASCLSNLRQLGAGFHMYQQDFDGCYPYWNWDYSSAQGNRDPNHLHTLWFNAIYPYVKNAAVFQCPDAQDSRSLRETAVWDWTTTAAFNTAGIIAPLADKPVNYGMSETLATGRVCKADGPCYDGGLDRPSDSLLVADCLQGLTDDLLGRPKREDPADPWHNVVISRVAFSNGPENCYTAPDDGSCGARQRGTIVSFGAKAELYDRQTRHALGSNLCFADGHAKWMRARQITYDLFAGDGKP
jgi:prepilin-type N-terminal cleavage/methylation domain-containing protein/prepilin-type processing-associated H-X9-DG protein